MDTAQKKSYWLPCLNCDKKTDMKIHEDTVLINFPLYCPHCEQEILVNVVQRKIAKLVQACGNMPRDMVSLPVSIVVSSSISHQHTKQTVALQSMSVMKSTGCPK